MMIIHRRELLRAGIGGVAALAASSSARAVSPNRVGYVCPPCGCASDGRIFDEPGTCPSCGMTLVARDDSASISLEPEQIPNGASTFLARGGRGREDKRITVHCYRPTGFHADSPILLVLPGAGRNGAPYRDSWIEAADGHGVLVAALAYPEADYDFAAYQMGGVVKDLSLRNVPISPGGGLPNSLHLRDEDISFAPNPEPETWLFQDFDRIFSILARASGSTRTRYDIFGHSAGGQILARLAVFHPQTQADRIIAANSGLYTVPDPDIPLPFGLRGLDSRLVNLPAAFATSLTILLGEEDNDPDGGGQQLHTPLADRQGVHRLGRGQYFFQRSREIATANHLQFAWKLELVPGVGHDQRAMGSAAARLLYGR